MAHLREVERLESEIAPFFKGFAGLSRSTYVTGEKMWVMTSPNESGLGFGGSGVPRGRDGPGKRARWRRQPPSPGRGLNVQEAGHVFQKCTVDEIALAGFCQIPLAIRRQGCIVGASDR